MSKISSLLFFYLIINILLEILMLLQVKTWNNLYELKQITQNLILYASQENNTKIYGPLGGLCDFFH